MKKFFEFIFKFIPKKKILWDTVVLKIDEILDKAIEEKISSCDKLSDQAKEAAKKEILALEDFIKDRLLELGKTLFSEEEKEEKK